METTKFEEPWVLWYFDPRKNDWSLGNYKLVAEIQTPQQLWSIVLGIPKEAFECGYFFYMRKGIRPIWEVPENEHGGSWSKKIPSKDVYDTAMDLMIYSALELMVSAKHKTYVGFSTSAKGENNIIKLWMTAPVPKPLLNVHTKLSITDDVVFTLHKSRR